MKDTALLFKALADQTRLAMLWLLFNQKEICVCDFIEVLAVTQSRASRHLRILANAGLVIDRRDGLWKFYSLRAAGNRLTKAHLAALKATLAACPEAEGLTARLCKVIEKRAPESVCCA